MFASFLLPFAERGAGPIHHWVMLAQMARFAPGDIVFIADETYFAEDAVPFGQTLKLGGLRFTCPSQEQFRLFRKIALDGRLMAELHRGGTYLDILERLLVEEVPGLVRALKGALTELVASGHLEAVLAWCNCPSLRRAMDELGGGPIVHNELGALRSPLYRDTFYFDLQGVNGATTAASWKPEDIAAQLTDEELFTDDELRGLLVADFQRVESLQPAGPTYAAGVALQVEDDSNMIAFARGWTSISILYEAMGRFGPASTLVRSHPGARFTYQGGLGVADTSSDSLDFLNNIGTLISINSSLLAEAALWSKPFEAKGDTPALCLASLHTAGEDVAKAVRNAFFLGYLVPSELLFDAEYYRWRLAGASLGECVARHAMVHAGGERPVTIAGLSAESRYSHGEAGLVRLPPLWTSTLAIEGQLEGLRADLAAVELSRQAEAERLRVEIEALKASAQHWQSEAEENWRALEWFKGHVEELQRAFAKDAEQRDSVEHELGESRVRAAVLEARVQDEERLAAELRQRLSELQVRLDAALAGRDEIEGHLAKTAALAESLQECVSQAHEALERRQQHHSAELSTRDERIRQLESEISQFVMLSARITAIAGHSTGSPGQASGSELRLSRDKVEQSVRSIDDSASAQSTLVERMVATTAVLPSSERQDFAVTGDLADDEAQTDHLVLVSGRVAPALGALERLRESRDQALEELATVRERLGRTLKGVDLPASEYPLLSSQIDRLNDWISTVQERQVELIAEVGLLKKRRSLLEFVVGREIRLGMKYRG